MITAYPKQEEMYTTSVEEAISHVVVHRRRRVVDGNEVEERIVHVRNELRRGEVRNERFTLHSDLFRMNGDFSLH